MIGFDTLNLVPILRVPKPDPIKIFLVLICATIFEHSDWFKMVTLFEAANQNALTPAYCKLRLKIFLQDRVLGQRLAKNTFYVTLAAKVLSHHFKFCNFLSIKHQRTFALVKYLRLSIFCNNFNLRKFYSTDFEKKLTYDF